MQPPAPSTGLDLLFVWHFHQPHYALEGSDEARLPWVRLHATKSYYDMAWMLSRHPAIRSVANFSGVLLEQLAALEQGATDRWEWLSSTPPELLSDPERSFIVRHFFSCHWERCVRTQPRYAELLALRGESFDEAAVSRFSNADLRDLQLLFNLQWFGFGATADYPLVASLRSKQRGFDAADVAAVLGLQREVAAAALAMWRSLIAQGQVELSLTPHGHPILPLLIDSDAARVALPQAPLPHPAMREPADAVHHIRTALSWGEQLFGVRAAGMWPAEGSVSPAAAEAFAAEGLRWIASDDEVLQRSERPDGAWGEQRCRPWAITTARGSLNLFFRNHELSDRIGFAYAANPAEDAARDLIEGAQRVAAASGLARPLVTIILDGENAWESYEQDGFLFLEALYGALAAAPGLQTVTASEALERNSAGLLRTLHSGSWISASFRIWIGSEAKNRGWELLIATRAAFAAAVVSPEVSAEAAAAARRALDRAEGSDWFWWYGDDFDSQMDEEFDQLFRGHCRSVYTALGLLPPLALEAPVVGVPPPAQLPSHPIGLGEAQLDGRDSHFFEWRDSAAIEVIPRGAMNLASPVFRNMRLMRGRAGLYLRLDGEAATGGGSRAVVLRLTDDQGLESSLRLAEGTEEQHGAWQHCVELLLPLRHEAARVGLFLEVSEGAIVVQRWPLSGLAWFDLPRSSWFV